MYIEKARRLGLGIKLDCQKGTARDPDEPRQYFDIDGSFYKCTSGSLKMRSVSKEREGINAFLQWCKRGIARIRPPTLSGPSMTDRRGQSRAHLKYWNPHHPNKALRIRFQKWLPYEPKNYKRNKGPPLRMYLTRDRILSIIHVPILSMIF